MVPMVAANIAEPPIGAPVVEMLEALPPREREFYSDEDNVIDPVGKCDAVFQELQERHAFIGGSYSEYVAYMNRTDMPPDIWHFSTATSRRWPESLVYTRSVECCSAKSLCRLPPTTGSPP